mgnify:CR=1 FL=1
MPPPHTSFGSYAITELSNASAKLLVLRTLDRLITAAAGGLKLDVEVWNCCERLEPECSSGGRPERWERAEKMELLPNRSWSSGLSANNDARAALLYTVTRVGRSAAMSCAWGGGQFPTHQARHDGGPGFLRLEG